MTEAQQERMEAEMAQRQPTDPISAVVGSPVYATHHRFAGLRIDVPGGFSQTSAALSVSRYYLAAGVVVDVVAQPERFEAEIAAKRAYCAALGIRYALVRDSYDDESVREQLVTPVRKPSGRPATQKRPRTRSAAR